MVSSCGEEQPLPQPPSGTALAGPRPEVGPSAFVTFESGQVRPLALSAGGDRLFAVNTPDNRLEIFEVSAQGLRPQASVAVGMEPVAVAEAANGQVWVVNHLSDSVSVIDVQRSPPRVVRTLWVGDEPRDIVFAGDDRTRAFVTTAHRGQNSPVDPQLTTPGVGRADVWVFDSEALDNTAGGTPLAVLTLFGDTPRGLATSPDGSRVYAAVFRSGNRTTSMWPQNLRKAAPTRSADGARQPDSGLIIRYDGNHWVDELGALYDDRVPFSLPDFDVFAIDAVSDPPREVDRWAGVGTTLMNLVVNPVDGAVYVSNLEARNHVRFAGAPVDGGTSVRGHLTDSRVTVIRGRAVEPRVLNKHIDFTRREGTEAERETSLSMPMGLEVSADGQTLYVAAFGSGKVGVVSTSALADDTFALRSDEHVELTAGGPSGLVLDEARGRAYVLTRFDNGISTVDLATRGEVAHLTMPNPEPATVVEGRPFLYDARLTSSNGNDSCATCHLFGDTDGLAWDLGDPNADRTPIENVFITGSAPVTPYAFHPLKGPMTTQSMRGLTGHGPMHWRGDRSGRDRLPDETLEEAAFKEFNEAFESLMGRAEPLTDEQMQKFTDFAMQIRYPPNPIRNLDGTLSSAQSRGRQLYDEGVVRVQTQQLEVCARCHPIDPAAGLFGTSGLMSDNGQDGERNFKIPHFRDQYQKVGMFGWAFEGPPARGRQVRGFGYNHNGATSGNFVVADLGISPARVAQLRAFLFAFPTESPFVLGQQVTLTADSGAEAKARIDLLVARAKVERPVPECDLIVKGVVDGAARGWLMTADERFVSDRASEAPWTRAALEAAASVNGQALTFTCAPWGSGRRMGIDRDEDGLFDGDEA